MTLLLSAQATVADVEAPFPTANRSPLILPLGLPDARGAALLPAGALEFRSTLEFANTSLNEPSLCGDDCSLTLDGETARLALGMRRGLAGGWEASAVLPLLRHSGGFLDSAIEGWHDVFSLPNGDRDQYPQDRLRFQYRPESGGVALADTVSGIGDLQLGIARQLGERFALRGQLKLPSGDTGDLTGSGGTDAALSLHFSSNGNDAGATAGRRLYAHLSGGVLFGEDGKLLPEARERWLAFGSATLGWRASEHWHLKVQVDGHSAAWDSPREALGDPSAQLVVGATGQLGKHWLVDLAFSEDIVVERSPDIVFHLGLRWQMP
ncbi:DUF3187 family protein [Pseudohaliea rubra]|uniref:DUF3187 family protein n=1 Tax=Pseudohaliea rubra DSM 19751 TaxID=1265313 RepID=A0A095VNV8_9GAMM|nr:DUF3187 family protein [Pseudohaliea rubra]KGE02803.1 hypothetical protein HRUBRA_02616 [Pseudohaliea rubra DSM 19751]